MSESRQLTDPMRLVIVAIPGGGAFEELSRMITILHDLTGSRTAASYPPHITLRTGAIVPSGELERFTDEFGKHIEGESSFIVKTEGLRSFSYWEEENQKHIILYPVRKSPELAGLNARLLGYDKYKKSNKSSYQPHISLLYGDIDGERFDAARRYIGERPELFGREFRFRLDNISLLRQGEGFKWSICRKFILK